MFKAEGGAEQTHGESAPISSTNPREEEQASGHTAAGLLALARRSAGIATVLLARSRSPLYRPETQAALAVAASEYTARAEQACREVLTLLQPLEHSKEREGSDVPAIAGGSRTCWDLLATLEAATRIGAEVDQERSIRAAGESGDVPLPIESWADTISTLATRLREEMQSQRTIGR